MIEPSKITSSDLNQALHELEDLYIDELENMLMSQLMDQKSVHLYGKTDEILEFAGRTNYKIRLRIPNKNVWSISFKDFRESIRKVLRTGPSKILDGNGSTTPTREENLDYPTNLLLHVLPNDEYKNRSFVGNKVNHPTWGVGKIVSISDSGNVEVEFTNRKVILKPNFIKLVTA